MAKQLNSVDALLNEIYELGYRPDEVILEAAKEGSEAYPHSVLTILVHRPGYREQSFNGRLKDALGWIRRLPEVTEEATAPEVVIDVPKNGSDEVEAALADLQPKKVEVKRMHIAKPQAAAVPEVLNTQKVEKEKVTMSENTSVNGGFTKEEIAEALAALQQGRVSGLADNTIFATLKSAWENQGAVYIVYVSEIGKETKAIYKLGAPPTKYSLVFNGATQLWMRTLTAQILGATLVPDADDLPCWNTMFERIPVPGRKSGFQTRNPGDVLGVPLSSIGQARYFPTWMPVDAPGLSNGYWDLYQVD